MLKEPPLNWGAKRHQRHNKVNDKRDYYRSVYLKSEHWKHLKSSKLKESPFCESCGVKNHLEAHHIRYGSLYDILTKDLLTLCRSCHTNLHEWIAESKYETWDAETKRTGLPARMRARQQGSSSKSIHQQEQKHKIMSNNNIGQRQRIYDRLLLGGKVSGAELSRIGSGKPDGWCASFSRRISEIREQLTSLNKTVVCHKSTVNGQIHTEYEIDNLF